MHRSHQWTNFDDLYVIWCLTTQGCSFWRFCWYTSPFRGHILKNRNFGGMNRHFQAKCTKYSNLPHPTQPHMAQGSETTKCQPFLGVVEGIFSWTLALYCGYGYAKEEYAMKRDRQPYAYTCVMTVKVCIEMFNFQLKLLGRMVTISRILSTNLASSESRLKVTTRLTATRTNRSQLWDSSYEPTLHAPSKLHWVPKNIPPSPTTNSDWQYVALVVVLWCPALSSSASVTALRWELVNVHV